MGITTLRDRLVAALLTAPIVLRVGHIVWLLSRRPGVLTRAQWRVVRRLAKVDTRQQTPGDRLSALCATAPDGVTKNTLVDAYWWVLGVESPYHDE